MDIDSLFNKYSTAANKHSAYPVDFNDFIVSIDHICDYPDQCESWMIDLFTPDELDFIIETLSED